MTGQPFDNCILSRRPCESMRKQGPITTGVYWTEGFGLRTQPIGHGVWVPAFAGTTRKWRPCICAIHTKNSSCPDLIRVSINLRKSFFKKMDHRVRPGDDDLDWRTRSEPSPISVAASAPPN